MPATHASTSQVSSSHLTSHVTSQVATSRLTSQVAGRTQEARRGDRRREGGRCEGGRDEGRAPRLFSRGVRSSAGGWGGGPVLAALPVSWAGAGASEALWCCSADSCGVSPATAPVGEASSDASDVSLLLLKPCAGEGPGHTIRRTGARAAAIRFTCGGRSDGEGIRAESRQDLERQGQAHLGRYGSQREVPQGGPSACRPASSPGPRAHHRLPAGLEGWPKRGARHRGGLGREAGSQGGAAGPRDCQRGEPRGEP